jgi:membrane-bound lytic murein transglycosylase F
VLAVILAAALLTGYVRQPTTLNLIKQKGELVVVTHLGPTTYYEGPNGETGFEYDMARRFADYLGVRLRIVVADNLNAVIPTLLKGEADIAAAGLTVTPARKRIVRFGPSYEQVTQQLIYRKHYHRPPSSINDVDGYIEVVAGSSHAETLKALAPDHRRLQWEENYQADIDGLLSLVWQKELDYTIADSNQIEISRRYYPELGIAFDLSAPDDLAWAFPRDDDYSLYREAGKFFQALKQSGELALLKDRYFGHLGDFDYVDTRTFIKHINRRLTQYKDHFIQAAEHFHQDWRLLAAIGYQESHWDPKAISPTGVRGIMMLTRKTAADMGIKNRIKPENSIRGGARYFTLLEKRIPDEITGPDRTWFALAAYNIGLGHVNDARIITERLGGNPNKWMDVRDSLPLLMQKRWYKQARHGYARGLEAVHYVENIRNYFDILIWHVNKKNKTPASLLVRYNSDPDSRPATTPVL